MLVVTGGTAVGYDWPIVDPSFRPTPASLAAIREDVLHPWVGPDLRVRVTVPGGGGDDVTLLSSDGRTVLATGSWASSGGKSVEYRVCGARSLRVRVTRGAAAARFILQVQAP